MAPVPESHPIIHRIDTATRLRHRIFFSDASAPGTIGKPEGVKFCEIRLHLAAAGANPSTAPTDPDAMDALAMESRAPHRNDFEPGDEGKMAHYACRWINSTGKPGPWGPIATAIVPG